MLLSRTGSSVSPWFTLLSPDSPVCLLHALLFAGPQEVLWASELPVLPSPLIQIISAAGCSSSCCFPEKCVCLPDTVKNEFYLGRWGLGDVCFKELLILNGFT